jgi:hypothetical protein
VNSDTASEALVSDRTLRSVRTVEVTLAPPGGRMACTMFTRRVRCRQVVATGGRRRAKSRRVAPMALMFENKHVAELEPANWRQKKLGQGSFGARRTG